MKIARGNIMLKRSITYAILVLF